jgi:putative ABC transport system substrate-binding protein
MRWCSALGLAVLCVLVVTKGADAQQSARVWHLGILSGEPPTESLPVVTPFLDELRNLGYANGHNLVIERRWAETKEQKLRSSAAELARNKVDVIVAITAASVIAAKQVTMTIPIVMIIKRD